MEHLEDPTPNYSELFGLSPNEQSLISCDEPENQLAINEVLYLLSKHLKKDLLADNIHEPTDIFDGLSILESLAKDPEATLDVIRQSFDQSTNS